MVKELFWGEKEWSSSMGKVAILSWWFRLRVTLRFRAPDWFMACMMAPRDLDEERVCL